MTRTCDTHTWVYRTQEWTNSLSRNTQVSFKTRNQTPTDQKPNPGADKKNYVFAHK